MVSTLCIVALSLLFLPAHANNLTPNQWAGRDDGEFTTTHGDNFYGNPDTYQFAQESISNTMSWFQSAPNNKISMEYNPDLGYSQNWQQDGGALFQSAITSDSNGCLQFIIQIYGGSQGYTYYWPSPSSCYTVSGALGANTGVWYIQENMDGQAGYIQNVQFEVLGNAAWTGVQTLTPASGFLWIRSNICVCGTNGDTGSDDNGNAYFNSGTSAGTLSLGVGCNGCGDVMVPLSPPAPDGCISNCDIGTLEGSNMPYQQGFSNPNTSVMTQTFGPMPSGGGGCVAKDTPILTPRGYVPVQSLHSGDIVMGYDLQTRQMVPLSLLSNEATWVDSLVSVNNGALLLTSTDQPVYVHNSSFTGWERNPQNLRSGDSIYDVASGHWVPVFSIQPIHDYMRVYDLVDTGSKTFIANGYLMLDTPYLNGYVFDESVPNLHCPPAC